MSTENSKNNDFNLTNIEESQRKNGNAKRQILSKVAIDKNPERMKKRLNRVDEELKNNFESYLLVDVIETPIPPPDINARFRAAQLFNRCVTNGKAVYDLIENSFSKYVSRKPWLTLVLILLAFAETAISFQGIVYLLPDILAFGKYIIAFFIPALLSYTAAMMSWPLIHELFYKIKRSDYSIWYKTFVLILILMVTGIAVYRGSFSYGSTMPSWSSGLFWGLLSLVILILMCVFEGMRHTYNEFTIKWESSIAETKQLQDLYYGTESELGDEDENYTSVITK
ncbi:MAG: hypothetical protein HW421_1200 [Ignavibacteria bacterium]|nr:hypothetical protein [Ignavibacteria bacterium]